MPCVRSSLLIFESQPLNMPISSIITFNKWKSNNNKLTLFTLDIRTDRLEHTTYQTPLNAGFNLGIHVVPLIHLRQHHEIKDNFRVGFR